MRYRFMDWMHTNDSEIRTWADRPTPKHATFSRRGVALEWMIDLCNRQKADAWFCMPHEADDDFVRRFAQTVKDGLDPSLKIYIEYSNEVWNGQFKQCKYAIEQGLARARPQESLGRRAEPTARRSMEIFAIWEQVFGGHARFVRVIPTQSANRGVTQGILRYPGVAEHADALAIAPYMAQHRPRQDRGEGPEAMTSWTTEQMFADFEETGFADSLHALSREQGARQPARAQADRLRGRTAHGRFHGGPARRSGPSARRCTRATATRVWASFYRQYYDEWAKAGGDLFAVFSSIDAYSNHGAWGLAEFYDNKSRQTTPNSRRPSGGRASTVRMFSRFPERGGDARTHDQKCLALMSQRVGFASNAEAVPARARPRAFPSRQSSPRAWRHRATCQ